jgi:hypothetical protein
MRSRPWLTSILCGSIASILLNAAAIVWNSDGSHNRVVERFFMTGSLMFSGFESGVLVVMANMAVFGVLLTLLILFLLKIFHFTQIED